MGGNVFHTTATRLTTAQLLLLLEHTRMALSPYFSGLEITRFFEDKLTHGDLDVVVGLWTGGDGWKGANEVGTCPSNPPGLQVEKFESIDEEHEWSRKEVREFCGLLAEKLGARKWAKNGMEASFAVPLSVIDKDTTLTGEDDFYQIDLIIHHPPNLEFAVLTQSYGVTALLFAAAVRRLSSSFTCHNDRFVIRYSPYNGLKAIEVELTHDPEEFMAWAGLDANRFGKGFKSEDDYFMWLTCQTDENEGTPEEKKEKYASLVEKRFQQGWKKMAGRRKETDNTKMPKGHGKIRLEVMARFRDWMLTTAYGVEAPSPRGARKVDKVADDLNKLDLAPPAKPVSAREQNLIDPAKFQELSPIDISALEYFAKKPQWESAFEGRREEAKVMSERQKRNNKENAAVQKAKEDAKAKKAAPVSEQGISGSSNAKAEDMDEGVSL